MMMMRMTTTTAQTTPMMIIFYRDKDTERDKGKNGVNDGEHEHWNEPTDQTPAHHHHHCFLCSAVTRGKCCRIRKNTHTQELQIHTNTPQKIPLHRKKENTHTHTHTQSLRKTACKPFSTACLIPKPIVSPQRLFAPELLTLSSPLIQIAHHLCFSPTDNPIMRASIASKTSTTTPIMTNFCWGQPSTYSAIRIILSGKQQQTYP